MLFFLSLSQYMRCKFIMHKLALWMYNYRRFIYWGQR